MLFSGDNKWPVQTTAFLLQDDVKRSMNTMEEYVERTLSRNELAKHFE